MQKCRPVSLAMSRMHARTRKHTRLTFRIRWRHKSVLGSRCKTWELFIAAVGLRCIFKLLQRENETGIERSERHPRWCDTFDFATGTQNVSQDSLETLSATWAVKNCGEKQLTTFVLSPCRRVVRISWTEYKTNVWVRQKIGVPENQWGLFEQLKKQKFGQMWAAEKKKLRNGHDGGRNRGKVFPR